jgi:hypothetical protein
MQTLDTEFCTHSVLGFICFIESNIWTLGGNQPITTLCTSSWGWPWIQVILRVPICIPVPSAEPVCLFREVCVWAHTEVHTLCVLHRQYKWPCLQFSVLICRYNVSFSLSLEMVNLPLTLTESHMLPQFSFICPIHSSHFPGAWQTQLI